MTLPNFRNASNTRYTKSLFEELCGADKSTALYSLKTEDGQFPSLYLKYIAEDDLTEYTFANKYFENWDHWEVISNTEWLKPFLVKWRKELKLKIESVALKNIVDEARNKNSRNKFTASKTILDRLAKDKPVRGRPSKDEVSRELKRQTFAERELAADLKRVLKEPQDGES